MIIIMIIIKRRMMMMVMMMMMMMILLLLTTIINLIYIAVRHQRYSHSTVHRRIVQTNALYVHTYLLE